MNKKSRLEKIIQHYSGGKPSLFAKYIGVAPSTISSWLSRDTLDYDLLFAKCENLSCEWLLTGRGEMLRLKDERMPPVATIVSKEECSQCKTLLKVIENQNEMIDNLKQELIQQKK